MTGLRIPIRYKMLGLISAVLIVAMVTYLVLANSLFQQDKRAYIYDLNASLVEGLSEQTSASLQVLVKEVSLVAREMLDTDASAAARTALLTDLFSREPNLLRVI